MTPLRKFDIAEGKSVGLRVALFYAAIFLIVGIHTAFLPLWLSAAGLSEGQISLIYAMPVLLRAVFTVGVSFIADRFGRHVQLLKFLSWGALLSVAVLPFRADFVTILVAFTLFALFWTTVIPLTDAVALAAARSGVANYGRMRLWGSASYIAVILVGGVVVDLFGPPAALWLFLAATASMAAASGLLPRDAVPNGAADGAYMPVIRLADLSALIRLPLVWLFLAATSLTQATHAVYYVFGTIHWTGLGIAPTAIGGLWSIGVVAEIALFAFAARIPASIGPVQLIAIGAAAAALRWSLTSLDPPLPALFALQAIHGLTFGATHLGAMQFVMRAIPPHMAATSQGIYASVSGGLAMGVAYLAAGPLYRSFGAEAFLGMAALALLALAAALLLARSWNGDGLMSPPERR